MTIQRHLTVEGQIAKTARRPRRMHFALAALGLLAFAAYGSFVPLDFEPLSFRQALHQFQQSSAAHRLSRSDFVVNAFLFVPIAFFFMGALLADGGSVRRRLLAPAIVLAVCAAASVVIEFGQVWFVNRISSRLDIVAQSIGVVMGIILWYITGQTLTEWARSYSPTMRRYQKLEWFLQAYLIGLLIYTVMPFDFVISPSDLAKTNRDRIVLVPFADLQATVPSLYAMFRDFAIFIPVGMLLSIWGRPADAPLRSPLVAIVLGAMLVVLFELLQLLIVSRFTTTTDMILGTLGVACGVGIMWRYGTRGASRPSEAPRGFARALGWFATAVLYAVVPLAVYCTPFEPISDSRILRDRFHAMISGLPLADLNRGSRFNAGSDVVRKIVLLAPIGAFLALGVSCFDLPHKVRRMAFVGCILLAAALGLIIELVQVALPDRVPNLWDVVLYAIGGAIAVCVVARLTDGKNTTNGE